MCSLRFYKLFLARNRSVLVSRFLFLISTFYHRPSPSGVQQMSGTEDGQRHFAAVGRIVSNWAYLELVIDDWCARISDINPEVAACFSSQVIGSMRKLDALSAISHLYRLEPELAKNLKTLSDKVRAASEKRNRYVHDSWTVLSDTRGERLQVTARKKLFLG